LEEEHPLLSGQLSQWLQLQTLEEAVLEVTDFAVLVTDRSQLEVLELLLLDM
jgi:hypothetical protein